jgi:hypothetical protein
LAIAVSAPGIAAIGNRAPVLVATVDEEPRAGAGQLRCEGSAEPVGGAGDEDRLLA